MEFLIGAVIVWFLGGLIWSRVYFRRRHGLKFQDGIAGIFIPGQLAAVFVGMAWPVSVFTHWRPEWCKHPDHVLARDDARVEFEQMNARYEQALRNEQDR